MKTSWIFPILAVATSVAAQVSLQRAAKSPTWQTVWFCWMVCAVLFYAGSMLSYWRTLQFFPISKIGPVVTVGVVLCVFVYGACMGETIRVQQYVGLGFAAVAFFLLAH